MAKKKSGKIGGAREGAGRPIEAESKAIVIAASVPGTLVEQLDAHAATKGWGRSRAVTEAIRAYVARKRT
jgi:hypothetical protein